jgi:putative ABC transport system permease protein
MITVAIVQGALEVGLIYSLVALALFLSFSILNIADLTTDGCFTLGCAVSATVCLTGHPFLALLAAIVSGLAAGFVTAFLQTRLGVPSILAGIITNTGLYTINIMAMGFTTNISLFHSPTIFSTAKEWAANSPFLSEWYKFIEVIVIVAVVAILLILFMATRLGMSIRATGDNEDMVRASSINPKMTITVGLCLANAMTALSGGMLAQYQKSADVNLGTGMVVIGLASLIIGETLFGKRGRVRWITGVIIGSVIYRFIIAIALRFNVPAESLKLISAIIVAAAIAVPAIRKSMALHRRKVQSVRARREGGEERC